MSAARQASWQASLQSEIVTDSSLEAQIQLRQLRLPRQTPSFTMVCTPNEINCFSNICIDMYLKAISVFMCPDSTERGSLRYFLSNLKVCGRNLAIFFAQDGFAVIAFNCVMLTYMVLNLHH